MKDQQSFKGLNTSGRLGRLRPSGLVFMSLIYLTVVGLVSLAWGSSLIIFAVAPVFLGSIMLAWLRPAWAPVQFVFLLCTLPVLAYGIGYNLGAFTIRPHYVIWSTGLLAAFLSGKFVGRGSAKEIPVWGLIGIACLSWLFNVYDVSPGVLGLFGPILAWSIFLLAARLGGDLPTPWIIAGIGVVGSITAFLAAITVLSNSDGLYNLLFLQGTTYLPLFGNLSGNGRGMYIPNAEGFLTIAFCLMLSTCLLARRFRWIAGLACVLIGLRILTAYSRTYLIMYGLILMAGIVFFPWASFRRRLISMSLIIIFAVVAIRATNGFVAGAQPGDPIGDLMSDWSLRFDRFFALDARLDLASGSGGATMAANNEALQLFMEDPLALFLGTSTRGGKGFNVDVGGPLGLMTRWGLLGLGMMVWFIIGSWQSIRSVLRNPNTSTPEQVLTYGVLLSLLGFLVYSSYRFPMFASDESMAAFCLVAGMVEAIRRKHLGTVPRLMKDSISVGRTRNARFDNVA